MNMLKQYLTFERLQEVNSLTPGQCRLWYALMYIDNITGWQDWFTVASSTLENRCRLSKNGLLKARKGLIKLGYLQVKVGVVPDVSKKGLLGWLNKKRLISPHPSKRIKSN